MHRRMTCITLAAAIALWSAGAAAQTVDEIVQKNLAALGGEAALRQVESIETKGTMTGPDGRKAEVTAWQKRPKMRRQDVTIDGQTMTMAFDGHDLWMRHPRTGGRTQLVTGDAAEAARAGTSFDPPFLDYKARGIDLELQGAVDVDGAEAYKLEVSYPEGPTVIFYVDADNGLVLRNVVQDEVDGKTVAREERYSDWRRVDGIMLPFRTETLMNGRVMTVVTLTSAALNPDVDDSFFTAQP